MRVPPISTQAAEEELQRAVLVRREARGGRPEAAGRQHRVRVRRLDAVAPAGGPPPARRSAASASAAETKSVALAALAEERLRLQVEARERAAGLLARLLRRGQDEPRAGARQRDVEEAALLLERAAGARAPRRAGASREVLAVEERVLRARERREPALDEVADEDRVPLEPLRLVHGQERDGVRPAAARRAATRRARARRSRNAVGNVGGRAVELVRGVGERGHGRELLDLLARRVRRLERAEVLEPLPERVDRARPASRCRLTIASASKNGSKLAGVAQRAVERPRLAAEAAQLERVGAEERRGEHAQRGVVVRRLPGIRGGELEQRQERVRARMELRRERRVERDPVRPQRVREPRADLPAASGRAPRSRPSATPSSRSAGDLARDPVRLLGGVAEGAADDLAPGDPRRRAAPCRGACRRCGGSRSSRARRSPAPSGS